jgi:hypothetical protein
MGFEVLRFEAQRLEEQVKTMAPGNAFALSKTD